MSATKTVTISGWITYDTYKAKAPSCFPGGPWDFWVFKPASAEHIPVFEHSFDVQVPADFDPRPGLVEALQAEKRKVEAEFAKRVTDIERQISELQALEFNGSEA